MPGRGEVQGEVHRAGRGGAGCGTHLVGVEAASVGRRAMLGGGVAASVACGGGLAVGRVPLRPCGWRVPGGRSGRGVAWCS